MRDIEVKNDVPLWSGRSYEHDYGKNYKGEFPFDIERLPSDSDDYYNGYCTGMEKLFELVKRGDLADMGVTYNETFEEDCDDCEDCPCFDDAFNEGYDIGFKKGVQIAHEELEEDIYINGCKMEKFDDIRNKVMALGNVISSDNVDAINDILSDLTDLMKDIAWDAVEEYLGYR